MKGVCDFVNKEVFLLIVRGILKSHHITDEMLVQYFTKSFDSQKSGIPNSYFYNLMESKLLSSIEIALSLLEDSSGLNTIQASNLLKKELVKG